MSEVEAVEGLILASQAKPVQFDAPEGRTFVAIPSGEGAFKLEQITSPNKADVLMPKVVTQHVKMQTAESLADYINRFKSIDTMLFADIASDTIVSVIDYDGMPDTKTKPAPDHGIHRLQSVVGLADQFMDQLVRAHDPAGMNDLHDHRARQ